MRRGKIAYNTEVEKAKCDGNTSFGSKDCDRDQSVVLVDFGDDDHDGSEATSCKTGREALFEAHDGDNQHARGVGHGLRNAVDQLVRVDRARQILDIKVYQVVREAARDRQHHKYDAVPNIQRIRQEMAYR